MRLFGWRLRRCVTAENEPADQAVVDELADQTTQNETDMTEMATTLSVLQDEMDLVNTPAENHFKPWWLLAAIIVAVIIGGGTFIGVQRLTEVDENTRAIAESCAVRNEALTVINEKFAELNVLIAVSVRDADLADPMTRDFLAAFENLRKPIPLKPC